MKVFKNQQIEPSWILSYLICPFDGSGLKITGNKLLCETCKTSFYIIDGVPSFYRDTTGGVNQKNVYDHIARTAQGKLKLLPTRAVELNMGFQYMYKTYLLKKCLEELEIFPRGKEV